MKDSKPASRMAIYPGTFDPVTYGHLDVLDRAVKIFGRVLVAVAEDTGKKCFFPCDERVAMLKESTAGLRGVTVEPFCGLVTDLARRKGTRVLVRGLRMTSDFEYEFQMALTNRRLAESTETVFLMPSEKHSFLSSSLIKQISALDADISSFVPAGVQKRLKARFVL